MLRGSVPVVEHRRKALNMGASVSAANERARAQQREAQAKMEAELSNLNEILLNRQHLYLSQLINNKGEDKTIPVKTFLEVKKHLSVDVSSGPSKNLTDTLENLFGGHFLASLKAFALGAGGIPFRSSSP